MSAPKRLKAEDAESITSSTSIVSPTTSPSVNKARPAAKVEKLPLWRNFMRLSPEIRKIINNNVLYVGKLFPFYQHSSLPCDVTGKEYHAPPIEWIMVLARMQKRLELEGVQLSSDLKAEGEEALYGQNTVIVGQNTYDEFFGQYVVSGDPNNPDEEYQLFSRNHYITSVQVDTSPPNFDTHSIGVLYEKAWSNRRLRNFDQRDQWIERTLHTMVEMVWAPMFQTLTTLPLLTYLEVNVERVVCPMFCHRLINRLVRNDFRLDEHQSLKTFVVSRIFDAGETQEIRDAINRNFGARLEAGLTVILRADSTERKCNKWLKDEIELR